MGVTARWALGECPGAGTLERLDRCGGRLGDERALRRGVLAVGRIVEPEGIDETLMSDFTVNGVHEAGYSRVETVRASGRAERTAAPLAGEARLEREDRVELSDRALFLSKLKELPEVREELIAQARERIASGAYDSGEVLDATVDALARDLDLLA